MKRRTASRFIGLVLLLGALIGTVGALAGDLSGNEILARVDQQAQFLSEGSMIVFLQFDNQYADGTTAANRFASLSKRVSGGSESSLIYFLEPEDVQGTIFLSLKPDPNKDARMWLYLPALGMAKELVAEQQKQSFAGSTFSYKDVGSREMGDKYNAQLSSEDTVTIDGEDHSVYVLALTAKPDSDADYPTGKMWVDKEGFIMLKSEDYNESGNLERSMEVAKLGEFEGEVTADQMVSTNVLDGSSTTITFLERKRPEGEFSEDLFDPENLASFDPAEYGF